MNEEKTAAEIFDSIQDDKPAAPPPDTPPVEANTPPEPPTEAASSFQEPDKAQAPSAPAPEIDFSSLPEPVRKRLEALEAASKEKEILAEKYGKVQQERDALAGRVPGLQRELAALKRTPPAPAPLPPADSHFDSDQWKDYERNYPEEAKAHRAAIEAQWSRAAAQLRAELKAELENEFRPRISQVEEFVSQAQKERELRALKEAHPDCFKHFGYVPDPETGEPVINRISDEFRPFFETLPPSVRELAFSDRAADVKYVFDLFEKERKLQEFAQAAEASKQHDKRNENLKRNAAPNVGPQPNAARAHPQTPEEIFDSIA